MVMQQAGATTFSTWVRNLQFSANGSLTVLFASALSLSGCSGEAGTDDLDPGSGGSGGVAASGGAPSAGSGGSGLTGGAGTGSGGTAGSAAGMSGSTGAGAGGAGTGGVGGGAGAGGSLAGSSGAGSSSGGQSGAGAAGSAGVGAGGAAAGTAGAGGSGGSAGAGMAGMAGAPDLESCKSAPIPAPPAEMVETIDITWDEMTGEFSGLAGARSNNRTIGTYPSWALDHVMWSGGELNFCVRWDSDNPVSETLRDDIEDALDRGVNAWFSALAGYDCFPYPDVAVRVTGWAVRDRATLMWSDDTIVPIYVNQLSEGAPACPSNCSRFSHQDPDYDFSSCAAGPEFRVDQFVWLEQGYTAPNGWDMGCHLNQEEFVDRFGGTGLYHIWLHEFGHSIGFPDYYDWDVWAPNVDAPRCVMNAGAAATVTDWDKWMLKRTWSELLRDERWM